MLNDIKEKARVLYKKDYLGSVLASFLINIVSVIFLCFSLFNEIKRFLNLPDLKSVTSVPFSSFPVFRILLMIAIIFVTPHLNFFGHIWFLQNAEGGRYPDISESFSERNYLKILLSDLLAGVCEVVCFVPAIAGFFLWIWLVVLPGLHFFSGSEITRLVPSFMEVPIFVLFVLSVVSSVILFLCISLGVSMKNYMLFDDPALSAIESLKQSFQLMKGQKKALFMLYLHFFGWLILSVFTCGLLDIFMVSPWMCQAKALFYTDVLCCDESPEYYEN